MAKKYEGIAKFGYQVGVADRAMAILATMVAEMAAAGDIDMDDASQAYNVFLEERRDGAGLPRIAGADTKSDAVQISKLRRFIEVGARFRKRGVRMLERTSTMHMKELSLLDQDQLRYRGEYNALIEVARRAARDGHVLNDAEIRKLLVDQ